MQLTAFFFFFSVFISVCGVIFTLTSWLNVTLWDSLHSLSFHSLAPLLARSLARSSCRACSLNRLPHSSNIHSQSGTLLFSLTFSYIHPFLLWFGGTFDGSKSNTRTSDPHTGIWVNRMGLCSISQLLLSASRCHRGNCKQLGYSLGNPLML